MQSENRKYLNIPIPYTYRARVIPWRARKERYQIFEGANPYLGSLPVYTVEEAPLAFRVRYLDYRIDEHKTLPIRFLNNDLWKPATEKRYDLSTNLISDVTDFVNSVREIIGMPFGLTDRSPYFQPSGFTYRDNGEEIMTARIAEHLKKYIIIDSVIYVKTTEPRYVVTTSTYSTPSVQIQSVKNYFDEIVTHIKKDQYFRADDFEGAVEFTKRYTEAGFNLLRSEKNIDVLLPQAVRLDPQKDYLQDIQNELNKNLEEFNRIIETHKVQIAKLEQNRQVIVDKIEGLK